MQGVIISDYRKGKDMLTGKEMQVVFAEFQDGTLKGHLSLKSLEKLLAARAEQNGTPEAPLFNQPQ